ncbi:MAG: DUF1576 domain-containing protein, partial [Erysipelotrichaceae bacterium]|nr:DUF1576 domain-containing protein [Erysipelotrichaceae bacterium]
KYGSVTGIVLGMLHSLIVTSVVGFHGGFCLYNGGFTAGIIAMIITPFVETFFEASDSIQLLPKIKL